MSNDKKPTLEELLKLKRCEHPSDADWEAFDIQLKRKMLQTITTPKSTKLSFYVIKKFAALSAGFAALAIAILSPKFISNTPEHTVLHADSVELSASKTPLPDVNESLAEVKISTTHPYTSESPVDALIHPESNSTIHYVSNNLNGMRNIQF